MSVQRVILGSLIVTSLSMFITIVLHKEAPIVAPCDWYLHIVFAVLATIYHYLSPALHWLAYVLYYTGLLSILRFFYDTSFAIYRFVEFLFHPCMIPLVYDYYATGQWLPDWVYRSVLEK